MYRCIMVCVYRLLNKQFPNLKGVLLFVGQNVEAGAAMKQHFS